MTDTAAARPTKPINVEDVPWTEVHDIDNFNVRFRHLSMAMGPQPYKIGVAIEELPPSNQTNPAHYHMREEEHILILAGALTVRIGKEFHVMKASDYVRFPAGSPHEHCLYNHTKEPCLYIIVGSKEADDVCVYPDSNKVWVEALGQRFMRNHQDYWVDEGKLTGKDPNS